MKSTHSGDLEFLKGIRGCFGSRRIWSIEYEFTGEEIIERRGGKIKNQIRIYDIVETNVPIGRNLMILKTNRSKMIIKITPSLKTVISRLAAEETVKMSESERHRMEEAKRRIISRYKLAAAIGAIVSILVSIGLAFFMIWLKRKH